MSDAAEGDSFLQLAGRRILVMGVANRKSVAWRIAEQLEAAGAEVVYTVRSEKRREQTAKLLLATTDLKDWRKRLP